MKSEVGIGHYGIGRDPHEMGMNRREVIIFRDNWAFFTGAMIPEVQTSTFFEEALYHGQHAPVSYGFAHAGYPCRLVIDAVDLSNTEVFLSDLHKAISHLADRIPSAITGTRNEQVLVVDGRYRFQFQIVGYWCRQSLDDEDPVEDPTMLPEGECLGRQVKLRVGLAV